jgi:peroxiredoxin Q/BCP
VQVLGVSFDKPDAQKSLQRQVHPALRPHRRSRRQDRRRLQGGKDGQGPLSLAKRSCFLIKDGKVVWQDYAAASTDQQAADIKRVLGELK